MEQNLCPNCNSSVPENANVCPYCGKHLREKFLGESIALSDDVRPAYKRVQLFKILACSSFLTVILTLFLLPIYTVNLLSMEYAPQNYSALQLLLSLVGVIETDMEFLSKISVILVIPCIAVGLTTSIRELIRRIECYKSPDADYKNIVSAKKYGTRYAPNQNSLKSCIVMLVCIFFPVLTGYTYDGIGVQFGTIINYWVSVPITFGSGAIVMWILSTVTENKLIAAYIENNYL